MSLYLMILANVTANICDRCNASFLAISLQISPGPMRQNNKALDHLCHLILCLCRITAFSRPHPRLGWTNESAGAGRDNTQWQRLDQSGARSPSEQ